MAGKTLGGKMALSDENYNYITSCHLQDSKVTKITDGNLLPLVHNVVSFAIPCRHHKKVVVA